MSNRREGNQDSGDQLIGRLLYDYKKALNLQWNQYIECLLKENTLALIERDFFSWKQMEMLLQAPTQSNPNGLESVLDIHTHVRDLRTEFSQNDTNLHTLLLRNPTWNYLSAMIFSNSSTFDLDQRLHTRFAPSLGNDPTTIANLLIEVGGNTKFQLRARVDPWLLDLVDGYPDGKMLTKSQLASGSQLPHRIPNKEVRRKSMYELLVFASDLSFVFSYLNEALKHYNDLCLYTELNDLGKMIREHGYEADFPHHRLIFADNITTLKDVIQLAIGDMRSFSVQTIFQRLDQLAYGDVHIQNASTLNHTYANIFSDERINYHELLQNYQYPYRDSMRLGEVLGNYRFGVLAAMRDQGRLIDHSRFSLAEGLVSGLGAFIPNHRVKGWGGCPASAYIPATIQACIKLFPALLPGRYMHKRRMGAVRNQSIVVPKLF